MPEDLDDEAADNDSVAELNKLKGNSVIRMKSASEDQQQQQPPRRLDWRLGQKINALMKTDTKNGGGGSGIVLGQGTAKDLTFQWLITPWSECSQPCGTGVGFRVSITNKRTAAVSPIRNTKSTETLLSSFIPLPFSSVPPTVSSA